MLTKKDVDSVIKKLNEQVFVSEAHLQLAFALEIDSDRFEVYPEFPAVVDDNQSEFDLLIRDKKTSENSLIEFKYKTANNTKNPDSFPVSSGVTVELKNHGAIDFGWYDSWKDISRIEKCVSESIVSNGFFILVTNDRSYWEKSEDNSKQAVIDLYMNEGRHNKGKKQFKDTPKKYRGSRNNPIEILNDYSFKYALYCKSPNKYGEFRILIVEIGGQTIGCEKGI